MVRNGYTRGGARIYDIPSTGILVTQFEKDYGMINKQFTYFPLGQIKRLPGVHFQDDKTRLDQNKTYAFYGRGYNIGFPREGQIGVEVLTICKPTELPIYSNEPFIECIASLPLKEISYANLVKLKRQMSK